MRSEFVHETNPLRKGERMRSNRMFFSTLALTAGALPFLTSAYTEDAPEVAAVKTSFRYRPVEKWEIVLPEDNWKPIVDKILIPHQDGGGFDIEVIGEYAMMVDTNGDAKLDKKIKGQRSFVKLRGKNEQGEDFTYAVRIHKDGGWKYQTSGVMTGKIEGTTVKVIDQNNNGRYDDYGKDAMIIGAGDAATLLSSVINVKNSLYNFEISEDGTEVTTSPYAGETATIDVTSKYQVRGKLIAAVLSNRSENHHFNAARSKKPMLVPAGDYKLSSGFASRSSESVRIRTGKMRPIALAAREEKVLEWGGPVVAEFDYAYKGETITVQPNVAFYGSVSGEEYHTFQPNAKSPKIVVVDKQTRKEVASGRFGGC